MTAGPATVVPQDGGLTPATLALVMEATWPPAVRHRVGPFAIRDGRGGGKRVSAATAEASWALADLAEAEAAMAALGQEALFLIRAGDEALDAALADRGYGVVDPVMAYAASVARLAPPPPPLSAIAHWPPLAVTAAIWAEAGIGPARLAVMERAQGPKTAILARIDDRAAGCCFVALSGRVAMLHALEVGPAFRRRGAARDMLREAAAWAAEAGADTLSLVVTEANAGARALYSGLGMDLAGRYHYRQAAPGAGH